MALQHSAAANSGSADIKNMLERIDRATGDIAAPPRHTENHRSAIDACVNSMVTNLCDKISVLRETLDEMQKTVIESAARSQHALDEHVSICNRVEDEIVRVRAVISDLAEQANEA